MTFLEQCFIHLLRELNITRSGHECPSVEANVSQLSPVPPT
jgi:hypothetical protein